VVKWFGMKEGEAILDVGTGTGVLLPLLGQAVGVKGRLIAMDFCLQYAENGPVPSL